MKYYIILFSVVLLSTLNLNIAKELPSFITKCKKDSSIDEIEKCFLSAVHTLMPMLAKEGLPELKLPKTEPLQTPQMQVTHQNLEIIWYNLDIYGFKELEIQLGKIDFSEKTFSVQFRIPTLTAFGPYQVKGKVLLFELNTSGTGSLNVTDFQCYFSRKFEIINKNGKDFANLLNITKLELNYGGTSLRANNIIPGNEQLSNEVNKLLNENFDEVTKELSPLVLHTLINLVDSSFIHPIFDDYSLDELFD